MEFTSIFYSIAAFVLAIGILVTIHEFGHFWVAQKLGVKVLRFSVGFGKPLWLKKAGIDQTEYVIAAIPLGGFVKMLDEREGDVKPDELHRAFNRQNVWKRFAIVAAGPLFNFLFAIFVYTLIYLNGVSGLRPIIGEVANPSVAWSAGIQAEDVIVSVNGKQTVSWEKARFQLLQASIDDSLIRIEVQSRNLVIEQKVLDVSSLALLQEEQTDLIKELGLSVWRPDIAPLIDEVIEGGAAEAAGMKADDLIISLNDVPIDNVQQWVTIIRSNAGVSIPLVVLRDGQQSFLTITPAIKQQDGETFGYIGVKNVIEIPEEVRQKMQVTEQYGLLGSFSEAVDKTWNMSVLTLKVLGKLIVGEASVKNLSGPITIARYAGITAQIGLGQFLSFLAVISISLGVLNLLPVPVLDGGHLFFYLIEIIKGSPVSEATEIIGQKIGVVLLVMLMTLAMVNDVMRLVG